MSLILRGLHERIYFKTVLISIKKEMFIKIREIYNFAQLNNDLTALKNQSILFLYFNCNNDFSLNGHGQDFGQKLFFSF